MAIKLTIDEGNSSVKVALWRDGVMENVATHRHVTPQLLRGILPTGEVADCAIYCSVCGRTAREVTELTHDIARNVIMLDAYTSMPIAIDYRSRHTLGADRIAAATGAVVLSPGRPALVVDMGTAITYDVVTADAHFAGGNIAPGIFVRLEALDHFTRALPLVETDGDVPRWGYDTSTAMRSGAILGVVGELQYYRHCLSDECDTDPAIILTGGSAELILPFITTPIIYEPNLVLIGLNRILDYNEN